MLNTRAQTLLFQLVDTFLETRLPVGSVTLAKLSGLSVSPATVRNVMADLEEMGLITSPHTSAGRVPTEKGLRFVAEGFLAFKDLDRASQTTLEDSLSEGPEDIQSLLKEATGALSSLSSCAGVVVAPKENKTVQHAEFMYLGPGRVLAILVLEDDQVENRLLDVPKSVMPFHLERASNYLNTYVKNKTLPEARAAIKQALRCDQESIDRLSAELAEAGVAVLSDDKDAAQHILVEGQANLLRGAQEHQIEALEALFKALETKKGLMDLLGRASEAESVQIFVGSDSDFFASTQCAAVLAPYKGRSGSVIGAVGVIGPTYMHYRRIIPMVDYTAHLLERMIKGAGTEIAKDKNRP